ncbi:uncharacterized protein [Spinacia oleracea]|uniref:Uncharacterized protein n=1 Tax=Spinacia oleracea TaxID=3562 RepID=A0ABM3QRG2_SPIOL|nr:uncharacterized protein LOC130461752 [Spinacia oleracea]XP_056698573.1 uncharacterized protein LOC130472142 [Spinacia oleracea]
MSRVVTLRYFQLALHHNTLVFSLQAAEEDYCTKPAKTMRPFHALLDDGLIRTPITTEFLVLSSIEIDEERNTITSAVQAKTIKFSEETYSSENVDEVRDMWVEYLLKQKADQENKVDGMEIAP